MTAALTMMVAFILFECALSVYAWHARKEAEKMLACARLLQPGVTTEAEFKARFEPFDEYLFHGLESVVDAPAFSTDEYTVGSVPPWSIALFRALPEWPTGFFLKNFMRGEAEFYVSPRFHAGRLSALYIQMLWLREGEAPLERAVDFYGPDARLAETDNAQRTGYDEYWSSGGGWLRKRVDLDLRATKEEQEKAFRFDLACFTDLRGCPDMVKRYSAIQVVSGK